jgi:hypothetical protein
VRGKMMDVQYTFKRFIEDIRAAEYIPNLHKVELPTLYLKW